MSKTKSILLTTIITGLLAFVIVYFYQFNMYIFNGIRNVLMAVGCVYGIKLLYHVVVSPWGERKVNVRVRKTEEPVA